MPITVFVANKDALMEPLVALRITANFKNFGEKRFAHSCANSDSLCGGSYLTATKLKV